MKVREFDSFEAFSESGTAGNFEEVTIVRENGRISADLMTECKSWKTAVRRFFKSVRGIEALAEWEEGIYESCESGYFEEKESAWDKEKCKSVYTGGWAYCVEDHDGSWYVSLIVRVEDARHESK